MFGCGDLKRGFLFLTETLCLTPEVCELVQQLPLTRNEPVLWVFAELCSTPLDGHRILLPSLL